LYCSHVLVIDALQVHDINDDNDDFDTVGFFGALVAVWYECRICSREVAGSNLSRSYFAPRSTQPSIPPGSVNEYQLRLGRQRQVWLIPIADDCVGVQVKL